MSDVLGRLGRPAFWWKWAVSLGVLGAAVGFAPIAMYDTDCGSALHPSHAAACVGRLDVRFTSSVVLLVAAAGALAIGLAVSSRPAWRAVLCFLGIIGVVVFPFIALSAVTHDEDGGPYCGAYWSQPHDEGDPELQAEQDAICGPFRSRQARLALWSTVAALASAGAIVVAERAGRRPEPVAPFVPNLG